MSWNDELDISRDLIVLIKHQLGLDGAIIRDEEKKRENISNAVFIAAQMVDRGETPSYRQIAKSMGVDASTVMRWFPDGDFIERAKAMAVSYRKLGIFPITRSERER